jgi:hypothetical protein
MCSGCSGNYEADGENEEGLSASSQRSREAMEGAVRPPVSSQEHRGRRDPLGDDPASLGPSVDEYDVVVSEERIVEVRRITRVSLGFRDRASDEKEAERKTPPSANHSSRRSAKRYATPGGSWNLPSGRFEVNGTLLKARRLALFERFCRGVRRFLG